MSKALIIGGGAPNSTLMAGALVAFEEKGLSFDVIFTCGAGVLIGLFYQAPLGMSPTEALKKTVEFSIEDALYNLVRINFKVFQKPGATADFYRQMLSIIPNIETLELFFPNPAAYRLFRDWVDLVQCTLCPSDLTPMSKGLCANLPFLDECVDFDKLPGITPDFYISAYNVTDRQMDNFHNKIITPEHVHASLSFPFIYPPYNMNGKLYIEGAAVDALNYKGLIENHPEVDTIVVFDILGCEALIQPPRDLYDAWVKSIIIPLVENARDDTKIFELKYNIGKNKRKLLKMPFDIPEKQWPFVLDWSRSNLETLFDIGYESGLKFCDKHKESLMKSD